MRLSHVHPVGSQVIGCLLSPGWSHCAASSVLVTSAGRCSFCAAVAIEATCTARVDALREHAGSHLVLPIDAISRVATVVATMRGDRPITADRK